MKKIAFLLLALTMTVSVKAASPQLSALFSYSLFYIPESNKPYVETYLSFDAWTLAFVEEEPGQLRATVEVTLVARRGDSIAYAKRYDLHSPYTTSSNSTNFTFMDLQRFGLANGIYDLEISLRDKNTKDEPYVLKEKLLVNYAQGQVSLSSLQLMSSATPTTDNNMLSRNGYDMVPYINDFVPTNVSVLHPYFELYNLDKEVGNGKYFVDVYIEQLENHRRIPNVGQRLERSQAQPWSAEYTDLDLSSLPSGNYNIVVSVCNANGDEFLKRETAIMRSNPGADDNWPTENEVAMSFASQLNEEDLNYYIEALYPIASPYEYETSTRLLAGSTLAEKQAFFFFFWKRRDAFNPEGKWNDYFIRLRYVDEHFSYPLTRGFKTDMGRVYLQYGPPDYVRDEKNYVGALNNPSLSAHNAYYTNSYGEGDNTAEQGQVHYLPYQLWRYNQLPGDNANRTFLFWDEFRGGYYRLLNSNARGELRTAGWERMLSRNTIDEGAVGEVGQQFNRGY